MKELTRDILWDINYSIRRHNSSHENLKELYLGWDKDKQIALIELEISQDDIDFLNSDSSIIMEINKSLNKYFRFTGEFAFSEWDLPF